MERWAPGEREWGATRDQGTKRRQPLWKWGFGSGCACRVWQWNVTCLTLRSKRTLQKGLRHFSAFSWKEGYMKPCLCWKEWKREESWAAGGTEALAPVSVLCCTGWGGQPVDICVTWFSALLLLNGMCTCEHKCSVLWLLETVRFVWMSGRHGSSVSILAVWPATLRSRRCAD